MQPPSIYVKKPAIAGFYKLDSFKKLSVKPYHLELQR